MAGDPRLPFQVKSLPIRAIHGNDALVPFTFTAGIAAMMMSMQRRIAALSRPSSVAAF
jgi:hypothetical protein